MTSVVSKASRKADSSIEHYCLCCATPKSSSSNCKFVLLPILQTRFWNNDSIINIMSLPVFYYIPSCPISVYFCLFIVIVKTSCHCHIKLAFFLPSPEFYSKCTLICLIIYLWFRRFVTTWFWMDDVHWQNPRALCICTCFIVVKRSQSQSRFTMYLFFLVLIYCKFQPDQIPLHSCFCLCLCRCPSWAS